MHAIKAICEKFTYTGWWPIKEMGEAEKDMDGNCKDRSKDVQPTREFGPV